MNKNKSHSEGVSQITEIKPDEELRICTFCGNKNSNEIENKIVKCGASAKAWFSDPEKDPEKEGSKMEIVDFDSIEWNIFLCHSCIVSNRKKAFIRELLRWLGIFLLSFVMLLVIIPILNNWGIEELRNIPAFNTIWNIFLFICKWSAIICIIFLPFVIIWTIIRYLIFTKHKSEISEKDKEEAFIEAGTRILEDVNIYKNKSKFRHFLLPKVPKSEDVWELISKRFPNKRCDNVSYEPKLYITLSNKNPRT